MHFMALHKVHVQIDYRARLAYHSSILMAADSALFPPPLLCVSLNELLPSKGWVA